MKESNVPNNNPILIGVGGVVLVALLGAVGASVSNSNKEATINGQTYSEWNRELNGMERESQKQEQIDRRRNERLSDEIERN